MYGKKLPLAFQKCKGSFFYADLENRVMTHHPAPPQPTHQASAH